MVMLPMTVSGALRKRKKPAASLWSTNTAYAKLIFRATVERDRFFHILHAIRLDKTARNQWSLADKLASIRDVFRIIISIFPMEYASNDHITAEEQLSGVDR
jgi:hypothetical protein